MILSQAQCPYCKEINDIDYDPNRDFRDGETITIACPVCENNFCAVLDISFSVSNETIAPCQNGGEHKWDDDWSVIDIYSVNRHCEYCGEVDCQKDPEKVKAYIESLNLPKVEIDTMGNQIIPKLLL